jgi:hypothetical protein
LREETDENDHPPIGRTVPTGFYIKAGPRQSFMYVYDRAEGLLVRRVSREAGASNMVTVRELQFAGRR